MLTMAHSHQKLKMLKFNDFKFQTCPVCCVSAESPHSGNEGQMRLLNVTLN